MIKNKRKKKTFSRFFPTPRFLEMPFAGLTISDDRIRLIEFKKTKHGLVLGRHGEKEIDQGVVERGYIQDKNQLVEILKEMKASYGLEFIKTSLPEDKMYLFRTDIPWVEDEEIRDTVEFKIEENAPVKISEAVFDYNIIDKNKSEDYISLVVSVLPTKTVDAYLEVFREADLTPLSLAVESQAICQSVIKRGDNRTFMILNVGSKKTNLFIVSEETVQFTSSLNTSIEANDTLIFDPQAVENQDSGDKNLIGKTGGGDLSSSYFASSIKEEIRKICDYWQTHKVKSGRSDNKIEKILITGEIPGLENLASYLDHRLKNDVEIGNVWTNAFAVDSYIPEIPLNQSLAYASTVGLALPYEK